MAVRFKMNSIRPAQRTILWVAHHRCLLFPFPHMSRQDRPLFIFSYMYLERVFYALYKRDTLKVSYIPLPFMFTCMKKEFPARKLKETFTNTKLLIIGFMERVIEHLPLVKLLYDIYLTLPLKCYMYDYRNKDVPNALSCLIRICK